MKSLYTILLLIVSNAFMTLAWYGPLKFKGIKGLDSLPILAVILISWSVALLEYCFMVPANRIGYIGNDGPFTLIELKVIQEVISLTVFMCFALIFFQNETLKWNHMVSCGCLVMAVFFAFKK